MKTGTIETPTRILAIETSCDETAAAVVDNGRTVLSNVVASQAELHSQYGGVFPEVASRKHVEVIYPVIENALRQAHVGLEDIDCVAVTRGPGLVGSLLVGMNAAKGLSAGRSKPLLGINHIEGHIYSIWLSEEADHIEFPILSLVVSGGHTELYLMLNHGEYRHLGGTLDDAAGEAFDKVSRLLNLGYPGGPAIEEAARSGDPTAFMFPRAVRDDAYNFSFSGLKTAVLREVQRFESGHAPVNNLAASFQEAAIESLVGKTANAAQEFGVTAVHVVGGVSANQALRRAMSTAAHVPVRFPEQEYCTDNAAMIAAAAHWQFVSGVHDTLDLDVVPSLQLI